MQQDSSAEERHSQLLDRTLNGLPSRRAPPALEARVLAAVQRRAALVWWRRSFRTWPSAARAGFVALSAALIGLSMLDARVLVLPVHRTIGLLTTMEDLGGLLTRLVHLSWVSYGALVVAALYAGLFGLGTVAYRILYLKPGKGE